MTGGEKEKAISVLRASKRLRSEDDSKQVRKSVRLAMQKNVDVEDPGECREAESKGIHDEQESLQDPTNHDVEIDIMEGNDISLEPLQKQKEINSLQTRIEQLQNEIANLKDAITKAQIFSNTWKSFNHENSDKVIEFSRAMGMEGFFNMNASEEDNERNLQEYLSGKQALLLENNEEKKQLEQKVKDLQMAFVMTFVKEIAEKDKVIAGKDKEINLLKENYLQKDEQNIETTATNYDTVSGLEYVRKSHRIGFGLPNTTNNIGLIVGVSENGGTKYAVRQDVDTTPASMKLQDAWKLVFPIDSSLNDDEFLETLRSQVPKLDNHFLKNAWKACQFEFVFDNDTEMGETAYQHFVYLHFSMLFRSAAQGSEMKYKAGQRVDSTLSLRCKSTEEDDFGSLANKIWVFPDAAVTLYNGWDTFGMMEVKSSLECNDDAYLLDNDKCVLMTALTAVAIGKIVKSRNEEANDSQSNNNDKTKDNLVAEFAKVAIPFVIATGTSCTLYVTVLDKNCRPQVRVVGYPVVGDGRDQNFSESPSLSRKKMFVALAVLLNMFREFFDDEIHGTYRDEVLQKISKMKGAREFSLRSKSAGSIKKDTGKKDSTASEEHESDSNPRSNLSRGKSVEAAAMEAAQCGGKFSNVAYPFERYIGFTESDVILDEQSESPFYFKCRHASSTKMTTDQIFLKVWKVEETNVHPVKLESMYHRMAFEAGVPVAAPIFHEIAKSRSSCGSEYLVFAVEYIHQDSIDNPRVFLQFCLALIDAVMALHDRARLLHCDLKPDNIRWSNGIVRLIDFERAQKIPTARWTRGTEGYEAPEIIKQLPCSPKTDTFSVGRTMLTMLGRLEGIWRLKKCQQLCICCTLREIANNLAASDHNSRWSLAKAAEKLLDLRLDQEVLPSHLGKPNNFSPIGKDKQTAVTPVVVPPLSPK